MRVQRLAVSGIVRDVQPFQDGDLVVLHHDTRRVDYRRYYRFETRDRWLTRMRRDGGTLWSRHFNEANSATFHIEPGGRCFVLGPTAIEVLAEDGSSAHEVPIEIGRHRKYSCFKPVGGGYVVGIEHSYANLKWWNKRWNKTPKGGPELRRLNEAGAVLWSTTVDSRASVRSRLDGQEIPVFWEIRGEPLLSDDCLLVRGIDWTSGVGAVVCIDLADGSERWRSDPGPIHTTGLDAEGRFLVGQAGYGSFEIQLYDRAGRIVDRWDTHGDTAVRNDGEIIVVEDRPHSDSMWENRVVVLESGGGIRRGPLVPGYHTGSPAISDDGVMYFWRQDAVHAVRPNLDHQEWLQAPRPAHEPELLVPSSTALRVSSDGDVVFGLGREVWVCRDGVE